jgi:hypothetical protein
LSLSFFLAGPGFAQPPAAPPEDPHQHHMSPDASASSWTFMQDGVVFGMFNHQGGPRGGDQFKVPNCNDPRSIHAVVPWMSGRLDPSRKPTASGNGIVAISSN